MIAAILSLLFSQWALLLGLVFFAFYKYVTITYDFFEKKNIPYIKPTPLLGSFKDIILQRESFFGWMKRHYLQNRDGKYIGVFEMRNPVLLITSPEIVKQVTVKDFEHFLNHRVILEPEDEPLFGNSLFSLRNQKWRDMRATLSPAFTGSKMRLMFQLVDDCGRNANKFLMSQIKNKEPLEVNLKDFYTRFTNDVIATCAFGLKIDSLSETENEFYHMSRKATNFSGVQAIKFFLFSNFKEIMRFTRMRLFDKKFEQYFHRLVLDTMQQRIEKEIIRPDMINLLMEARRGTLQSSDLGKSDNVDGFATVEESHIGQKVVKRDWTDDDIVSQCFLFFLAGFETSSVLMCFCAHELMENPEVQQKLIEEVDQVQEELAGKPLTYEVIQKMKYMDMVMSETLRKWPPAVGTDRVCNKTCIIGDKDGEHVKMNPGDVLMIPTVGFHHDPAYFPNPDKFDPERFSEENKDQIKPFTYMPFGVGPRNCIGSRFALMESKAIIYHLLTQFTFEASPKTKIPLILDSAGFQLMPKGGFWLNFRPRK